MRDGTNAFDPSVGLDAASPPTPPTASARTTRTARWTARDNPDPDPIAVADCDLDVVTIGSVQGSGATSPVVGQIVRIEGTVVGDFQQAGGLDGYFVQDFRRRGHRDLRRHLRLRAGRAAVEVSVGDIVNVAGVVSE